MARCLVGCGSNLGDRRERLDRAVELLRFMPGVAVRAVSRYRETRPVGGPAGQGPFLNAACLLETDLAPRELLQALFAVENTLERERAHRWAARTIDLDLLLYGDLVLDSAELTVPHPRMTTRRFVLEPGVEIAAGMRHPGSGSTLRELLDNISVPQPLVVVVGPPGSGATTVAAAVADATLARPLFAPVPVPESVSLADWRAAAIAWARPLATADRTDADPFTVADCWLEALPLAAADRLDPAAAEALDAEVATLAAGAAAANVAILLDVAETVLEDRLAADDAAGGTLVRAARPGAVAEAVAFQRRLVRRLRCPGDRTPRAVVTVDAADLERATADAVAAVEAML